MERFLEIATNVSTPIGLGGLYAAIFFLIARELVKSNIFPRFSKQLASDLVKTIIDRLFILSLVAVVLGFTGYVVAWVVPHSSPTTNVPYDSHSQGLPSPPFSDSSRITEQHSWKVFKAWMKQHPDIIRQYGIPRDPKFISVHEQNFASGYVAYNVTDAWSVWLHSKSNEFVKLSNPSKHLTPGSGREVDEDVFTHITKGMSNVKKARYRLLVDRRVKSSNFKGIGIIGGIGTLFIANRLLNDFGEPKENEFFVVDVMYGSADGYEILAGLRHGLGGTTPDSPKSVYVLFRDGRFVRHVVFPQPHQ